MDPESKQLLQTRLDLKMYDYKIRNNFHFFFEMR